MLTLKMSQPKTPKPILTPEIFSHINQAARNFDKQSNHAMQAGSATRNRLIDNISKFCYVLAANSFKDVDIVAVYDLARSMVTNEQQAILAEFYIAICSFLTCKDSDDLASKRLFGTEQDSVRAFWNEYVCQKIEDLGGTKEDGVDIMSILCSKAVKRKTDVVAAQEQGAVSDDAFDFDTDRFPFVTGKTIDDAVPKVKSQYNAYVREFKKDYLDSHGKPRSGQTWDSILKAYFTKLFRQEENKEDDQEAVPDRTWLPKGSHAWLTFVCYGPYGNSKWGTKPLALLGGQSMADIDRNPNKSRSAARKSLTTAHGERSPVSPVSPVSSIAGISSGAESVFIEATRSLMANDKAENGLVKKEKMAQALRRLFESVERKFNLERNPEKKEQLEKEMYEIISKVTDIERHIVSMADDTPDDTAESTNDKRQRTESES